MANSNIGTLTMGGGVNAPFNSTTYKPFLQSAYLDPSVSGYANWIGKYWSANTAAVSVPAGLSAPALSVTATEFVAYAPNDRAFLSTIGIPGEFNPPDLDAGDFNVGTIFLPLPVDYQFQGSNNGLVWVTLDEGTTIGTIGESIASNSVTGTAYAYHRLVFYGNGLGPVSLAQLSISGTPQIAT